ncbi:MAG: HTH domain-containing protein, partial [Clostridia bacterium]
MNGSWIKTNCQFLFLGGVPIGNTESTLKHGRILDICLRLLDGEMITKADTAQRYGVTERSIQRDIDDLRSFFSERTTQEGIAREIIYDRVKRGYLLRQ